MWCVVSGLRACLLCSVIAGAGVVAETDADASLQDVLAAALEANERLARLAEGLTAENARLREENARLRERDALREAELERLRAELAVLQRLVFGRSSERARPAAARDEDGGGAGQDLAGGRGRPPGWPGCWPWRGSLGCLERTVLHNHRLSRKASTGSGGRYRPGVVPGGVVRASARSFSSRSAWR